ncbi:MAG TPA: hypothetical protein VHC63_09920 [Acidimicrobiales bacterium]|nr:hypothetical protein [Acidimicrobiales bacterium]
MAKDKNKDAEPKQKSKLRTLFKWVRRISMVAAIAGAVRKVMTDQNEANKPPAV